MKKPIISVIVPFYKVPAFIERCAESLLNQTFQDVEFIFVDDASPDNTRQILESVLAKYPDRNTRIVTHETNMGLPSARKTGLSYANGDYIYNCDSDDWVEPDILESLYNAAIENNAEIAYCDFFLSFKDNERYMSNPEFSSADEMLRKGFLGGTSKWNVWNKLFLRTLYDDVEFPVNNRKGGEDMIVIGMMAKAKTTAYVPNALYHYVKLNAGAISESFSEQRLVDIKHNADKAIQEVRKYKGNSCEREISFFKLNVKLPFLISNSRMKYQIWSDWYSEANGEIMANKNLPIRTRLLQWMASKKQWWYVKLYYYLVYKFIYGIVYR